MKLKDTIDICIWSEDYEKLAKWYEGMFDLKLDVHLTLPDDTGYSYLLGGNYLYIGKHSDISGQNKDPYRIMIGFNVDSVTSAVEELKAKGVEFIADPFEAPPGGFWCATFKDLDGNVVQISGDK
jgi:predicted enzyme related to lactoylglutathione lyase